MSFKVVNTLVVPGVSYGEELLDTLDATLVTGSWHREVELITYTKDADAVICASPEQPWNRRVMKTLSKCRILATMSIGYDRIHLQTAGELGLAVTNIPEFCIDEVSSQAIAFIMALGRRLIPIDRAFRETQTHFSPGNRKGVADYAAPIFRMRDQTVGIVGLGKIGTAVAIKAKGLGMRVIAYDPYVLGGVMRSRGVEPVDFDKLLHESDYISINADLNEETRGMFGPEEFKKMKRPQWAQPGIDLREVLQVACSLEAKIDVNQAHLPFFCVADEIHSPHSQYAPVTTHQLTHGTSYGNNLGHGPMR